MSVEYGRLRGMWNPGTPSPARAGALVSASGLVFAVLLVYYDVVQTVGATREFYAVIAVSLLIGTACSRINRTNLVVGLGGLLVVIGIRYYLVLIPQDPGIQALLRSNVALLTGESVLQITAVDQWVLLVLPGPLILCWYLVLKRNYVAGSAIGLSLLIYLVLTGDAGLVATTLGIVSAAGLVGFGDLERREWSRVTAEQLLVVLAVMAVAPFLLTVVPGGDGTTLFSVGSGGGSPTMEENLVGADSSLEIVGSVDQSPEVRFALNSTSPDYWRTGSFDRYTGDGWIRTETEHEYNTALDSPPNPGPTNRQVIEAHSEMAVVPAAWKPIRVRDPPDGLTIAGGGLRLDEPLEPGDRFEVTSYPPNPNMGTLESAEASYPAEIEERYTQVPDETPDRVAEFTAELVSEAENPSEKAQMIEEWLQTNREYSLDVPEPGDDIADQFLFEMEAGYCTYHATTMATMLRTQDIPARLAVGYTPGEQVGDNRWVVRGLNSHAWVEVYIEDAGWVRFDPTPSGPRQQAEQAALDDARATGISGVDTPETEAAGDEFEELPENVEDSIDEEPTTVGQSQTETEESETETEPSVTDPDGTERAAPDPQEYHDESLTGAIPQSDRLILGAIVLVGVIIGVGRTRLGRRLSSTLAGGFRGGTEPAVRIERTYARLLSSLEQRHRPRRSGETVRQYLDSVGADERAARIAEIRQQLRYNRKVSEADAEEIETLFEEWYRQSTSRREKLPW